MTEKNGSVAIVATKKETKEKAQIKFNVGSKLDEAVTMYGSNVVFYLFEKGLVVQCKAAFSNLMNQGKTTLSVKEAQEKMRRWAPHAAKVPKTDIQKLIDKHGGLDQAIKSLQEQKELEKQTV